MVLSGIISEITRDIGQKSLYLIPHALDAPFKGVPVGILPYRLVWKD